MTDLHTHILHGMDDGAKELTSALAMLELEYRQGVRNVALTSHYHCETEEAAAFLTRRDQAFLTLSAAVPTGMTLKRGCEVFFSPMLASIDARSLCLEGTNYLLLELPILQKPAFLREVLTGLQAKGIVPLIAHVERYAYVRKDPTLLLDWIGLGAQIQVNAVSLRSRGNEFVLKLIKWGLVQVLASDAHSVSHRPPDLRQGLDIVSRRLGPEYARALERNAAMIFDGRNLPAPQVRVPRKVLGFWI